MTKQELAELVLANASKGKWLSCTVDVEGRSVGVKAFGKWVQRLECNGIRATVEECKTLKDFKPKVLSAIEGVMR